MKTWRSLKKYSDVITALSRLKKQTTDTYHKDTIDEMIGHSEMVFEMIYTHYSRISFLMGTYKNKHGELS